MPEKTTSPTVRRSHAQRRHEAESRILESALEVVSIRGSNLMSLAEVAERAGYSRGLPAHYFKNKEGLIASLTEYMVERFRRLFVRGPRPPNGLPAILARIDAYLDGAAEEPLQFRALQILLAEGATEIASPELRQALIEANGQALAYFAYHVNAGIRSGEIHHGVQPQAFAMTVVGAIRGVLSQWFLDPENCNLEFARQELHQMVIESLRR